MAQLGRWLQKNMTERTPAASAQSVSLLNWKVSQQSCGGRRKTKLDKHPGFNGPSEP